MARIQGAGFTLIEVLIAMAITALVALAAYTSLAAVLDGAEGLAATSERTQALHRSLAILDRDIRQFVDRPVRDEFGEQQPGLTGGPLAFFPLSLTRAGWHNSQGQPRSELQRVHYYLEDGALWRAYYPVLDRQSNTARLAVDLLEDVESIELRFLRSVDQFQAGREGVVDSSAWERNWIADRTQPGVLLAPPAALELRLVLEDLGVIRRLYVLPPI